MFQIPDLIVIIELIDNYELHVSQEDWDKSEEVYKYCVESFKGEGLYYDWREVMLKQGKIPGSLEEFMRFLRKEIVKKTGRVYSNV